MATNTNKNAWLPLNGHDSNKDANNKASDNPRGDIFNGNIHGANVGGHGNHNAVHNGSTETLKEKAIRFEKMINNMGARDLTDVAGCIIELQDEIKAMQSSRDKLTKSLKARKTALGVDF